MHIIFPAILAIVGFILTILPYKGKIRKIGIWVIVSAIIILVILFRSEIVSEIKQCIVQKESIQTNTAGTSSIGNQLLKAETYYNSKKYNDSIMIYKDLCQNNIPTAQINLAYFYSNGIGMDVNINKAIELYKQCAYTGNKEAIINLTALYANKNPAPIKDFIKILDFAKNYNIPNINKFLAYTMNKTNIDSPLNDDKISELSSKFYQLSYSEKETIINQSLFWEFSYTGTGKTIPASNNNIKYNSTGSYYTKDENSNASYPVYTYEIYKLKSRYAKLLEEKFLYVHN